MIRFNKPTIRRKDLESVLNCMIEDDLTPGNHLKQFSSLLSKRLSLQEATVFSNYCSAFEAVFHLMGSQRGDEVIMPSYTRSSVLSTLLKLGVIPILVDLEEDSLMPSIEDIKRKITNKTKSIIISQLFGVPYDLRRYKEFHIPLIEDLDGSMGSTVDGKTTGSFGDFITFNFTDDSIITTGSGGMLGSNDKRLRELVVESAFVEQLMSDFNASLGISQLVKLSENIERRKKIGEYYDNAVMAGGCSFIGRDEKKDLCYSSYIVRTKTPFEVSTGFFKKNGIPIKRGLDKPLHRLLDEDVHRFRNTENLYHEIVALPIYPELGKEDIENIVRGIKTVL
ncbi:MAG: DegT/DnrJ/EryC1/StrS aminotransferase family protein [Spirochaetota bacterium]|nr:MAG: DegT/DnrJ/EryC1/StrS aminotransferase family protein [Spirochaetota bacterium]